MSLKDIDNMINVLFAMKSDILNNIEELKQIDESHVPDEAELQGAVGYHPKGENKIAKAEVACKNIWQDKIIKFNSVSCREELSLEKYGDLYTEIETEKGKKNKLKTSSLDDAPNKIEIEHKYVLKESTFETVPNLAKAKYLIKKMYLDNSDELIDANVEWQPCGGTFVANVIDCYFLVEVNIDGLAIKETSREFYDSFVKEFSDEQ